MTTGPYSQHFTFLHSFLMGQKDNVTLYMAEKTYPGETLQLIRFINK